MGTWDASNNVPEGVKPWQTGTFKFVWPSESLHKKSKRWQAISSSGAYIFEVPGRPEMGVHAGREGWFDSKGRTGWQHETSGCIRTTEEAMAAIKNRFLKKDPLTHITVEK